MTSSAFDIAMEEYRKSNTIPDEPPFLQKEEKQPQYDNDPGSMEFSPFNVAEQIYTGKKDPSFFEEAARDVARTGSRMVETVLGLPGDTINFGKAILSNFPNAGGILGKAIHSGIGQENWNKLIQGDGSQRLPGQQDIQSLSEAASGGYTTPQGEGEEVSDEVFKTFTSLMTGGTRPIAQGTATALPRVGREFVNMSRKLGMSIAAESAKEGAKLLGAGEDAQNYAKMGSLMLMSLTLPRLTGEARPDEYLSSIYKKRDALIPPNTMVTPTGLQHDLQEFINNRLKYGGITPEKDEVLAVAKPYLDKLQGRAVPMDELLDMYRGINRNRSNVMTAPLDKEGVKLARKYYGEMADIFNKSIEGYLAPISNEALQLHRAANSGWSALAQSKKISNFVMDKAKSVPLKTGIGALFGGGMMYNPIGTAKALAGGSLAAGAGAAGVKGVEMAIRFVTNPTLRHYYNQVIINAMKENGPGTIQAMRRLDEQYQKELQNPKSSVNRPLPKMPRPEQSPRSQRDTGKMSQSLELQNKY